MSDEPQSPSRRPERQDGPASDLMVVGRVSSVHGLNGACVVVSESDDPDRFRPKARLLTDRKDLPRLVISSVGENSKGALLVEFAGVTDRARAEALIGALLLVQRSERRTLAEGEFWPDELRDLAVWVDGTEIGLVSDVIMGPQIRLVVDVAGDSQVQVPFVTELVPVVDLGRGLVEIVPLEGLFNPR